ncbi:hypothetical protein GWK36_07230 [Caldichromatium japonicum]|uniref:Uncharacterized protein n=1 Tax=Caldichromatium japonicum TaxID=2699430 RepID=A0A6G7VCY3_9GAMM|nr:hypothetical protein [Caldichromatium japonicum]QIK37812.1 hypothetical protein GWK36_07230 [Caldichromatium japonicum]
MSVEGLDLEYLEGTRILALPDGGYVAAAGVKGPGGLEIWVARFSRQHELLWTRSLDGPFDAQVTALVWNPGVGLLVAGELGPEHPGFMLALDDGGEPLWSRIIDVQPFAIQQDRDSGQLLVAGQYWSEDGIPVGLVASLRPNGDMFWRLSFPHVKTVRGLTAVAEGWAAVGLTEQGMVWSAGIDRQGRLRWERLHEGLKTERLPPLLTLADGRMLLAGVERETASLWLRWCAGDGRPLETQRLALGSGMLAGASTLELLERDDSGDLWLGGMTQGQDAWLARLSAQAEPLWLRVYGRDPGLDRWTDLRRHGEALLLGGISQASVDLAPGLWMAVLDRNGQPLAAPQPTQSARALAAWLDEGLADAGWLKLGGRPEVSEDKGIISLLLPFARLELPVDPEESEPLAAFELGWVRGELISTNGRWQGVLDWPARVVLWDRSRSVTDILEISERRLGLGWSSDQGLESLDLELEDLKLKPGIPLVLLTFYEGLALTSPLEELPQGSLQLGSVQYQVISGHGPRQTYNESLSIKDLSAEGEDNAFRLGVLELRFDYRSQDLEEQMAAASDLFELLDAGTVDPETLDQGIARLFQGSEPIEAAVSLSDLEVADRSAQVQYRLGGFALRAQGTPNALDGSLWTLKLRPELKELRIQGPKGKMDLDAWSMELAIERLAVGPLLKTLLAAGTDQPPALDSLTQVLARLLASCAIGFDLEGLHVRPLDKEPLDLKALGARLTLSDLDTCRPSLRLSYRHDGIQALPDPDVPPGLIPTQAELDGAFSADNLGLLLLALSLAQPDQEQALEWLARQKAVLEVKTLDLGMPAGRVTLTGRVEVKESDGSATSVPAVLDLDLEIGVQDLDRLIEEIARNKPPEQQRSLRAAAVVLKLMGEEKRQSKGPSRHRFRIQGDPAGSLRINDKDIKTLIEAFQ